MFDYFIEGNDIWLQQTVSAKGALWSIRHIFRLNRVNIIPNPNQMMVGKEL